MSDKRKTAEPDDKAKRLALDFMQVHSIIATGRVVNFPQENFVPNLAAALTAYAAERVAEEREACAKLADEDAPWYSGSDVQTAARFKAECIAARIRKRGSR